MPVLHDNPILNFLWLFHAVELGSGLLCLQLQLVFKILQVVLELFDVLVVLSTDHKSIRIFPRILQ